MPAYAIGLLDISDASWLPQYRPKTDELVRKHGGRYLVRGGGPQVLEGGKPAPSAVVVLEFPSMEAARAWYGDPEYAPMIKLRQSGSHLDFILVEGL